MKTICILNPKDPVEKVLKFLIPASENLELQQLRLTAEELTLVMTSTQSAAHCPVCGQEAKRVHSTRLPKPPGSALGIIPLAAPGVRPSLFLPES